MNVERIKDIINAKPNLSTALGMEFISTPEDDTCMARMKVDERNRQPFGFLSGGASLALAEKTSKEIFLLILVVLLNALILALDLCYKFHPIKL